MRTVETNLFVGNALEARDFSLLNGAGVEAVVDLAYEERPLAPPRELIYFRIPLIDGAENPLPNLQLAVETIASLAEANTKTLVACSAGMSRSPVLVAAALTKMKGGRCEDHLQRIAELGPCDVAPGLLQQVLQILSRP